MVGQVCTTLIPDLMVGPEPWRIDAGLKSSRAAIVGVWQTPEPLSIGMALLLQPVMRLFKTT
ncbi:MAG: hypothetical protein OQK10_12905 [Marinobacter sp.]|nr:hypothetical protein [Marinobacter sp.]